MNLPRTRRLQDACNIHGAYSAARHDCYSFAARVNKFRKRGDTLLCAGSSTGSQNPCGTRADHVFQRFPQIWRLIKRAVERHRQRPRQVHKRSSVLNVHALIRTKKSQHDAIHAQSLRNREIANDLLELHLRI